MTPPDQRSFLDRLMIWQRRSCSSSPLEANGKEPPLREELLNAEQLERHARSLATAHRITKSRGPDVLLSRLADNEAVLMRTYDLIASAAAENRRIAPAAEWLLDNFYLIEEQIRSTRRLLPRSYSRELPRLHKVNGQTPPRIYRIAMELISHTDGRFDRGLLSAFLGAYQSIVPLTLGELWSLPLMLRLAIVENLRRVAVRITHGRCDRDNAARWAEKMIGVVEQNPTDLVIVLADMARENPPLSGAFLAELTRHLLGQNPHFSFANSWLEHRLAEHGQTSEQLILAEGQAEAADHVSVGNSITSLRFVAINDWRTFVAEQSIVERTLSRDPAGIYESMDFATRDRYRHAVEAISRRARCSEYDVAYRAVQLAQAEMTKNTVLCRQHVGYFLVDDGRPVLEHFVEMRLPPGTAIDKIRRMFPLSLYLGTALVLTLAGLWILWHLTEQPSLSRLLMAALAMPMILVSSQLAFGIEHWLMTTFIHPQPLPKLDFRDGIPAEFRTIVAIPSMLSSAAAIERLLEALELRYLSNRQDSLHFALLTDFEDAAEMSTPEDAALLQVAVDGIQNLADRYADVRTNIFLLFHRSRRWNPVDRIWMGYERKRGKLADLNATLLGARDRFSTVVGDLSALSDVRYVITLDSDTQLPRDAAREMVGAMAHPLNHPVLDEAGRRVIRGYGVLQPRVGVSLPSVYGSVFARLLGGEPGIDPYTQVVSDVYQDQFSEGSFIGKGIYDLRIFEQLCSSFPDNRILSHDLLEGCYCRSGLLSDVVLYEGQPSSYAADSARRHRWIRGDWQIAAWILPTVPARPQESGSIEGRIPNPLSALSRWKILDNLRRSLVPAATAIVFLAVWILSSTMTATIVTVVILGAMTLPSLLTFLLSLALKPSDITLQNHLTNSLTEGIRPAAKCLLSIIFMPYEAALSLDAVLRTLIRLHWTGSDLLEWKTSSQSELTARSGLADFYRAMVVGPVVSLAAVMVLGFLGSRTLLVAGPMLLLWFLSPVLAWWLSRPIATRPVHLTRRQRLFLRRLARRTWRYFEVWVTAASHWLPPDNVQLNQQTVVAPRTSPTNIGMALVADLSACDFGYISAATLIDRTARTFATLGKMERYRGHLYNWYDTETLEPLHPQYVSTVDSGNLAGQLLVLRGGFQLLKDSPAVNRILCQGLADTLGVILEDSRLLSDETTEPTSPISGEILRTIERQIEELESCPASGQAFHSLLLRLIVESTQLLENSQVETQPELQWWLRAFARSCADHLGELHRLAAWTKLAAPAAPFWNSDSPLQQQRLDALKQRWMTLDQIPTLAEVAALPSTLNPLIDAILHHARTEGAHRQDSKERNVDPDSEPGLRDTDVITDWLHTFKLAIASSSEAAATRIRSLELLAERCSDFAEMDFTFLHNHSRDLFAIGFNVSDNRIDTGCYDLLASEARFASYVLIAQGHFGQEHWFALGRLLTRTSGAPALLSWSGSMFEYLMPMLVMPSYEGTLLDQTCRAVVNRQIRHGRQLGVPWGVSESGYNMLDRSLNYQYRAFGVPGLGLKRGLADDLVIAPYASAMALMVAPEAACRNLERLAQEGRDGPYGFFEAVDYTPARLPPGHTSITVRQVMAHHAGMTLLSIAWLILNRPMQKRFLADPSLRAADLLLHERVPRTSVAVYPHAIEARVTRTTSAEEAGTMRIFSDPSGPVPEVHLLSNGNYHVVVTSAGGGYSRWRDLAVTRWREDPTRDCWGSFCFLRDVDSNVVWSTAFHPTGHAAKRYEAIFTQARAEFRRLDEQIESHTEISVSSEDDVELRRVTLTNRSDRRRIVEVTSYLEVVLAPQAQDESHPAFSNLFVQSEILPRQKAVICTRRPRSAEEKPPWMIQLMSISGTTQGEASFETDRMKFIGRGRSISSPEAMQHSAPLSNTAGATLDPIISIRHRVELQPNESISVDLVTGVAEQQSSLLAIAEKYSDSGLAERVFELAWTRAPIMLQQLNATEADAQNWGRLAGSMIFASSLRRARSSVLLQNRRGQSGLWGHGISGDLPIMLVRIRDAERIQLVREAFQVHTYWRMKGLLVDLVVWNEDDSVYRQALQDEITDAIASSPASAMLDRPGGVFVRRGEQMSEEDRALLLAVARVILTDDAGTMAEQIDRRSRLESPVPLLKPTRRPAERVLAVDATSSAKPEDLRLFNGLGGFRPDGREYVLILHANSHTPAPWCNVIASPHIGTVISERGAAYTWAENSHEFRLTPWSNDPVSDTSGEAIYVRDEETGEFWSPTSQPIMPQGTVVVRHGFGYSVFELTEHGITTELTVSVSIDSAVKFSSLTIRNRSGRRRQLSVTAWWELVLGELRSRSMMHVFSEVDAVTGAIFVRNYYSPEFSGKVVFADCSESSRTLTGDRTEFLGRNGSTAKPAAMRRQRLSGRTGAGLDPCVALQTTIVLDEQQEKTIVFTFGVGTGEKETRQLVLQSRGLQNASAAFERVSRYWEKTLGAVRVKTPDESLNFLANGWLLYQTVSCRMWARTGFYQSGGAYGFRDQLQDAMALVHADPQQLRDQILRACSRQFREGDVQHWWHPPGGRGVRTHFSDDFLWLPMALCRYVTTSGDTGVLEERVPFLSSRPLHASEEANYDLPVVSNDVGTVYEHAVRSIENGLRFGSHGLPLMGCGDWNDGMNLVGRGGQGESVWLAFFLYDVLNQFSSLAGKIGDASTADRLQIEAGRLRGHIEQNAWDGDWYRRAYFDDGTPLGSKENAECQIDSISQSWSVLSGAGTSERTTRAMASVRERLVRSDEQLIQLLAPPFDKSSLNPGYIKGYVPGVRENGGQYTHSAIWTVMAFAALGDSEQAWRLFDMINPVRHGLTSKLVDIYRVEPYVIAADVYGVAPHVGRGGWTWYTGSSGWMYRLITESLLGLIREGTSLRFAPSVPEHWRTFGINYQFYQTSYQIQFISEGTGSKVESVQLDGVTQPTKVVSLVNDQGAHEIVVVCRPVLQTVSADTSKQNISVPTAMKQDFQE
ncbi:MAG: cyclic beta 1-2 glucan synthetase [Planctomycetaceae bacterium]|nr:cyclic beta 1-2 glucan synthetase [Planctomycetaceae bacterium]